MALLTRVSFSGFRGIGPCVIWSPGEAAGIEEPTDRNRQNLPLTPHVAGVPSSQDLAAHEADQIEVEIHRQRPSMTGNGGVDDRVVESL